MLLLLPILALLFVPAAAAAQEHRSVDCSLARVAFPPELAGWSDGVRVRAATRVGRSPTIAVGHGAEVTLGSFDRVGFAVAPAKRAKPGGFGGTVGFSVARRGVYRIALGGPAWVDLVRGRRVLASIAHAHGAVCTGVTKTVDFRLAPGRYAVQLSGGAEPDIRVLVARLR